MDETRDNYGRRRYRQIQAFRWQDGKPLLPEFDKMREGDRVAHGLYDGYVLPAPPVVSELAVYEQEGSARDQANYDNHVPGLAERARGYDIYGRPAGRGQE